MERNTCSATRVAGQGVPAHVCNYVFLQLIKICKRLRTLQRSKSQNRSGSKNSNLPSPQKRALWVKKSLFLCRAPQGKWGFLTQSALFWGDGTLEFFLTRNPLFPLWWILTPVGGGRVLKSRLSRPDSCSVDFGREAAKFWFEFCCGFLGWLFVLLFSPRKKAPKNPPRNPPQNSPGNQFGKIPLGFLQKPFLSASEKGVFWKRGLFRKVHFLENLEILEILENPQTVENKGESDHFLEIF